MSPVTSAGSTGTASPNTRVTAPARRHRPRRSPTVSMRDTVYLTGRQIRSPPVADRNLYLHEYVDIVGEGAMRYMEHVAAFDTATAADRGLDLVGTWYTMGSTGRWPQV